MSRADNRFFTGSIDDARIYVGAFLLASRETVESRRANNAGDDVHRATRALREKLLSDPHRPGYDFVIPEGQAMPIDPNGAIFWNGRYHLLYIFQDHRGHDWGHAHVSRVTNRSKDGTVRPSSKAM